MINIHFLKAIVNICSLNFLFSKISQKIPLHEIIKLKIALHHF